jgi:hypothetical protein
MIELGVNIDHVASVRQARRTYEPDPVWAAVEAHLGGADGADVAAGATADDDEVVVLGFSHGVRLASRGVGRFDCSDSAEGVERIAAIWGGHPVAR